MQASLFKPSRSPYWHLHLKPDGEPARRFSLKVREKQVAEQKKAKIVREINEESVGMLPAKPLREAAVKPLAQHLESFLAARAGAGKDPDYLRITRLRLTKIFKECGWKFLKDITADSFNAWRSKQGEKSAKTLNDYLVSMRTVLNWLEHDGKLLTNPLKTVELTTRPGGKKRPRRGYTSEEIWKLLEVADKTYALIIRMDILSGLRRNEVALLQWGDFHFEASKPYILLRAETVKNRKGKPHFIHPDLVEDLKAFKPEGALPTDAVFPEMPDMDDHRALLKAAGVPYVDENGRYADFHSFRKTHGTNLQLAGINQRTAMEQMRLSTPRLLDHVYTDCALLETAQAVAKLDGFVEGTKKRDKNSVQTSSEQSVPVPQMDLSGTTQLFHAEDSSPLESNSVSMSQETEKGSEGRARTYDQSVNSRPLYH